MADDAKAPSMRRSRDLAAAVAIATRGASRPSMRDAPRRRPSTSVLRVSMSMIPRRKAAPASPDEVDVQRVAQASSDLLEGGTGTASPNRIVRPSPPYRCPVPHRRSLPRRWPSRRPLAACRYLRSSTRMPPKSKPALPVMNGPERGCRCGCPDRRNDQVGQFVCRYLQR